MVMRGKQLAMDAALADLDRYEIERERRETDAIKALLDAIRSADGLTETERKCVDYVAGNCDGLSCERIVRLIEEMN